MAESVEKDSAVTATLHQEYKCDYCEKSFGVVSNRNRHTRRVHGTQEPVLKSVSCSLCEYRCRDKYQLKVHMRSHTKDRPFPCTKCGYSCSRREDLRRHETVCSGLRHTCPKCGESFRSRAGLDRHSVWGHQCGSLGEGGGQGRAVRLDLGEVKCKACSCNLVKLLIKLCFRCLWLEWAVRT